MFFGLKIFAHLSAALLIASATYGSISFLLKNVSVDTSFLMPSSKGHILVDGLPVGDDVLDSKNTATKKYLMRNAISLYWDVNHISADSKTEPVIGNAFLINVLSDRASKNPGGPYEPNWDVASNYVHLLLATSFTFASKLFDNIQDFKSEVNNAATAPNLNNSSSQSGTHKLKISQIKIDHKNYKDKTDPVYRVDKPVVNDDFLKNSYINLDSTRVDLVYAAVDLEVNKQALDLDPASMSNNALVNKVKAIQQQNKDTIVWKDSIWGDEYPKFAADFAVLKISIPIYDLKSEFLNHLKQLYVPTIKINKFNDGKFELKNKKTKPIVIGGWKPLSPLQAEIYKSNNLLFNLLIKKDQVKVLRTKNPSFIEDSNFTEYFELVFFDKVQYASIDGVSAYAATDIIFYPDDEKSILTIEYKLKNTETNITIPKVYKSVFIDFLVPDNASESSITNNLDIKFATVFDTQESKHKYQIFKQSANPIVHWSEHYEDKTYFDFESIGKSYSKLYSGQKSSINFSDVSEMFAVKDKKYVNIGHLITVPFIKNNAFKGAMAMSYNWENNDEDTLFGMYAGNWHDQNFISGEKSMAKVMMFTSPTRYDLIHHQNNYSRPSLGDSLMNKNMMSKLVKEMY